LDNDYNYFQESDYSDTNSQEPEPKYNFFDEKIERDGEIEKNKGGRRIKLIKREN